MSEAKEGYTRVKNIHTARVAGVPAGKAAFVKDWIAEHYAAVLIPVKTKDSAPKAPLAADLIAEIGKSEDEDRLAELAMDSRKTVREAAEFRLMELDEDGE